MIKIHVFDFVWEVLPASSWFSPSTVKLRWHDIITNSSENDVHTLGSQKSFFFFCLSTNYNSICFGISSVCARHQAIIVRASKAFGRQRGGQKMVTIICSSVSSFHILLSQLDLKTGHAFWTLGLYTCRMLGAVGRILWVILVVSGLHNCISLIINRTFLISRFVQAT